MRALFLLLFITLLSCEEKKDYYDKMRDSILSGKYKPSAPTKIESSVSTESDLQLIKSEPKVKDAIINESGVAYVSVIDNGTNRDGFASYICELTTGVNKVKIIKHGSNNDPDKDCAYGIIIGQSDCR